MKKYSSNPFVSREFIKEEFELRDRPELEISSLWKTLTVTTYLIIAGSGIAVSIAIGDITAAFKDNCILYAKLTLRNLDDLEGSKNLTSENVEIVKWGSMYDCSFCEYSAASSVVFGGILFVLFLQCGRGGVTAKGNTRAWEIVLPSLVINIIFFIMSSVSFAKTIGGLSFFCTNIFKESLFLANNNILSCGDILTLHFPSDEFNSNLYLDYVVALFGASVHFLGWFLVLTIIIFRCLLGVDFVVYRRQHFSKRTQRINQKRKRFSKKRIRKESTNSTCSELLLASGSDSSSNIDSDVSSELETSFMNVHTNVDVEKNKLI